MYIYNLCQYEPFTTDIYLVHKKEYTQEEFTKMCNEVEIKYKHSHITVICKHLEEEYGFKNIADYSVCYYEYNSIKC